MADDQFPDDTKLTRSKRDWAQTGRFLTDSDEPRGTERLPPGQHLVRNWPVLDLGRQPDVRVDRWRLTVDGAVARPVTLDWQAFLQLPQQSRTSDIHCVTSWSRYDNAWRGVATRTILDLVEPRDEASAVMLHAYDGYTTNLPLADFAAEEAILVHEWDGKPLARDHGGPMRLVVPHLYFWKSAKWLKRIEVLKADRAGFWEVNGYHMRGDPWKEQRYSQD